MSLLLIMLGAGFVFSLTSRFGAALIRTESASFFLPPIATFVNTQGLFGVRAVATAPNARVFAAITPRVSKRLESHD